MNVDSLIALSTLGFDTLKKFGTSDNFGDYTQKLVDANYLTPPRVSQDNLLEDTKAVSDFIGMAAQCHFLASWCDRGCPVVRSSYGEGDKVPLFKGPLVFEASHLGLVLDGSPVEWIYYSVVKTNDADLLYRVALGRGMFTMDEVSPVWHFEGTEDHVGATFAKAKKFISWVSDLYETSGFKYQKYPMKKSKARKLLDTYPCLPKLAIVG